MMVRYGVRVRVMGRVMVRYGVRVSTSKVHKSGSGFSPGQFTKGKPGRSNTLALGRTSQ